jgi:hypothetical protein
MVLGFRSSERKRKLERAYLNSHPRTGPNRQDITAPTLPKHRPHTTMYGENPIQHIIVYHSSHFGFLHNVMGMLVIAKDWGVFQDKNKWNGAKHRQIIEENLIQSVSTRHWEINSPFSRTIR